MDKFFRFWKWHFWLSNCLKSWSDCKICIFVWDFQNMVWNLGVDKTFVDFQTLRSTGRSLGSNQLHIQFTGQTSAVCRKRSKEKEIGKGGTYKIDLRRLRRNVQTLNISGDKTKQIFKHWRSTWKVHLRKLWQHGENIPGEMFRDHGIVSAMLQPISKHPHDVSRPWGCFDSRGQYLNILTMFRDPGIVLTQVISNHPHDV